jgi:hypothetical protein
MNTAPWLDTVTAWTVDPPWWLVTALTLALVVLAVRWIKRRLPQVTAGRESITSTHLVITALVGTAATVLIGFAFAMSYASLYEAATWLEDTPFGDLRWMFPIGIDAVIVFFLVLDLVMEWQGRRHPLARWAAYTLSAATVALNIGQTGSGEGLVGLLGHAGPPVVIILISEAVAAWVRHMAGMLHGELPDRIPAGRWIAQPWSTFLVARLMLGWGITSYEAALRLESARQYARSVLRQEYGRAWRKHTPRHVVWMLANGRDLPQALRLVDALTPSVPKTPEQAARMRASQSPVPSLGEGVPPTAQEGRSAAPEQAEQTPFADAIEAFMRDMGDGDGTGVPSGDGPVPTLDSGTGPGHSNGPSLPGWGDLPRGDETAPEQGHDGDGTVDETDRDGGDTLMGQARRALSRHPRMSARKLAEELGCSKSHAARLLQRYRDETRQSTEGDST